MENIDNKKVIIISAPSGSGKTTIVHHLLEYFPMLEFSISACSRDPRNNEKHSKDYYFLSIQNFKEKIKNQEFLEWEEVYKDHFYGTLKSEVNRIWDKNHIVVFDVDVVGGNNLKKHFKEKALSIFIAPPSFEVLEERLKNRGTDSEENIKKRIDKAQFEMTFSPHFDITIINDNLEIAITQTKNAIQNFIQS